MSFLNSVLNSISSGQPMPSFAPTVRDTTSNASEQAESTTSTSNGNSLAVRSSFLNPKRKAGDDLSDGKAKTIRKNDLTLLAASNNSGGLTDVSSPPLTAPGQPTPGAAPYRGTARPAQPASAPGYLGSASSSLASPSSAPPKKGSYQEIMQRAKAVQEARATAAAVKPQPPQKLGMARKERLARIREARKAKSGSESARGRSLNGKRSQSVESQGTLSADAQKPKRKPVDLGYKGTMRPPATQPAYKGTMKLTSPVRPKAQADGNSGARGWADKRRSTPSPQGAKKDRVRNAGYASYSEHESDDDAESDASSDMEAAAFDLEEEEERSLRAAKKEDELALAEEAELKRRKTERKNALAKMAAEARSRRRF